MRYSKEQQKEHISQIRRILVIKPDSSILSIQEDLKIQRNPLSLNKDYINKLVNRIRKERAKRLDYYTVNTVLANFQDEVEELKKRLWIIITDIESSQRDKIAAIRELRTSSKDLFDKMFDAGIFSRKLGELEIGKTLTDEEQELIKKAIELDYGKKSEPKPEPEPEPKPADTDATDSTAGGEREGEDPSTAGGENK
jgi:hypothetical protein